MKNLVIICLLISGIAQAQKGDAGKKWQNTSPEQKAEMSTKKWVKTYNLSADQQPKVKQVFVEMYTKMQTAMGDTAKGKKIMRQEKMQARANADTKLKAILTPEQNTLYEQKKKEKMEHKKEKGDGDKPGREADDDIF